MMVERGGSATQSGILYQNSIAALFLGRLIDTNSRPLNENVINVRVEAPLTVDDIVIQYADNHKSLIQAKENIKYGDNEWIKVWKDFDQQYSTNDFDKHHDRLVFQIGNPTKDHEELKGLCERGYESKNFQEWEQRLTERQKTIAEKIRSLISPQLTNDENFLQFIKHIDIEIWPLSFVERDAVPNWMPKSNKLSIELFRLLRDRVGGKARIRGDFVAHQLIASLKTENDNLIFTAPIDIEKIRKSVKNCSAVLMQHKHTFGNTGRHINRQVEGKIISWLEENNDIKKNVSMLIDQAGMGKTVILHDVLEALENKTIDVVAIKADQQLIGVSKISDIQETLGLEEPILEIVERLAKQNKVVVIIDQIDALSLSLVHDQRTLNVVFDLIARLSRIHNVNIIISCRLFDRNSDPRLNIIEIGKQFNIGELHEEQIQNILSLVQIDYSVLSHATKDLLKTPLHLDLFIRATEKKDWFANNQKRINDITTLQDLYEMIWQNIILRNLPNGPTKTDRKKVVDILVEYMDLNQQTSAPDTLFQKLQSQQLENAVNWLASAGIIIRNNSMWTFLHQTFFDYCYSRRFVEDDKDIVTTILSSSQGLFERSKLIQVLSYLRGTFHSKYLSDFQELINSQKLRYHLFDHIIRWFGSLPNPTNEEWILVQRILLSSEKREQLIFAMQGNIGWFPFLEVSYLTNWLSKNDKHLDAVVIPYLISMFNVTQTEIIALIKPYLGKNDVWDKRIGRIISTSKIHTIEAAELFEQLVYSEFSLNKALPFDTRVYNIGLVAQAYPKIGCRLVRFIFDKVLDSYDEKRKLEQTKLGEDTTDIFSRTTLYTELSALDSNQLEEALHLISRKEPRCFIDNMLPWFEQALRKLDIKEGDNLSFAWDDFSYSFAQDAQSVLSAFISSMCTAFIEIEKSDSEYFRQSTTRLEKLPYRTPQQLLAQIYVNVHEKHTEDTFQFLTYDIRRLWLGDNLAIDTRRLIQAIYPNLKKSQRTNLLEIILAYAPIRKKMGVDGLRRRGFEQLYLLSSIPEQSLSEKGIKRLRQLKRKFPNLKISDQSSWGEGGFIGSPIPEEIGKKMSTRNWLEAMQKYQKGIEHKEFLKGGARQLSGLLQNLIKDSPARFIDLYNFVPTNIDDYYAMAFIQGFAEAEEAPLEWLIDAVRRFGAQSERDIQRSIAGALRKRASENIPEDIVNMLKEIVYSSQADKEDHWEEGNDFQGPYFVYLNSDRGAAFGTLMRIYSHRKDEKSIQQKWKLVEFATTDPSTALRSGAIQELIYLIQYDSKKAIGIYDKLIEGHKVLLDSQFSREFIFGALWKNFLHLSIYIEMMMNRDNEQTQNQGAQLACIAAISPGAMESVEAHNYAQQLAEKAFNGQISCRRGAARIYARNLSREPKDICLPKVIDLVSDADKEIRREIDSIFKSIDEEYFFSLRDFIEVYAKSSGGLNHFFTEFLWKYCLLDTEWTLEIISTILSSNQLDTERNWGSGIEKLIRSVLQIYRDPTSDEEMKEKSMNIFDLLMERYSIESHNVLSEWDKR